MFTHLSKSPTAPPRGLLALLVACHSRIRRFAALAHRIGTDPEATSSERIEACVAVERYFNEALPLHVQDEEESILPRLGGRSVAIDFALAAMTEQHALHDATLDTMLEACRALRAAPDDRRSRAVLTDAAEAAIQVFDEHLALEESIIFPAVAMYLSEGVRATVVDELRSRREASTARE